MYIVSCTKNLLQKIKFNYSSNLANEKLSPPETPAFFQWTFIQNNFSHLPPSLHRITVPLFCWTCLWCCHIFHVLNCKFLLFPNKPIFAVKQSFTFKVNTLKDFFHKDFNRIKRHSLIV